MQKVCLLNDLTESEVFKIELEGAEPLGATIIGKDVYVFPDTCPHAEESLSQGWVENGRVVCAVHFAEFGLADDSVVNPPVGCGHLKKFPVVVSGGEVFADLDGRTVTAPTAEAPEPPCVSDAVESEESGDILRDVLVDARDADATHRTEGANVATKCEGVQGARPHEPAATSCGGGSGKPDMSFVYPKASSFSGFANLVRTDRSQVDRQLFWNEDIYKAELQQIFARAWLFLAHESQVPDPGDFIRTRMGEDDVIVVRQRDRSVNAFLNACPHRGNRVCMVDQGTKARGFICNYHGWSFGIEGRLRGTDGAVYDTDKSFEQNEISLTPVARIKSYKGLIFATFDPAAPSLEDFLGPFTFYLDAFVDNDEGGTEFIGGATRNLVDCNWKYPAENFVGDILHAFWTHQAGAAAIMGGGVDLGQRYEDLAFQASSYGHGIETNLDKVGNIRTLGYPELVEYQFDRMEEMTARLGETRARMVGSIGSCTIFPNLSFLPGQNTIRVWHPKGPHQVELVSWTFVNKNMPNHIKDLYRKGVMMTFSPGGVFEMDDGENWEYCTRTNQGFVTRHQPLHYSLGLGTEAPEKGLPGHIHRGSLNDANQRQFYMRWAEFMRYDNWDDLQASPTREPRPRVEVAE